MDFGVAKCCTPGVLVYNLLLFCVQRISFFGRNVRKRAHSRYTTNNSKFDSLEDPAICLSLVIVRTRTNMDDSLLKFPPLDSSIRALTVRRASLPSQYPRPSSMDRFIPRRQGSNLEASSYKLSTPDSSQNESVFTSSGDSAKFSTPVSSSSRRNSDRILVFSPKLSSSPVVDYASELRNRLEDLERTTSRGSYKRCMPHAPDRVLDMPNIRDDYFGNIMDWSMRNTIVVAINHEVYGWNDDNSDAQVLYTSTSDDRSSLEVKSVAWCPRGNLLAIGTVAGDIRVYHSERKDVEIFRQSGEGLCEHEGETAAIVWDKTGKHLYSAHKCGCVHDVDLKTKTVRLLRMDLDRSAGLQVSPDNKYLLVGDTRGLLYVWGFREECTVQTIEAHTTSAKALVWIPWQHSIFISGGGAGDGHIKMWNAKRGSLIADVETKSQICCMVLSTEHRELITGHGIDINDIIIWKLPTLTEIGRLRFHSGRVLQLCLSPDRNVLISLGADDFLMMWRCFEPRNPLQSRRKSCPLPCTSPLIPSIR